MKQSLPRACWLYLCAAALLLFTHARAAQPPPTTQKATIDANAFDPTDPAVTPELAKAVVTKKVSLSVTNQSALTALQEIAKQTGYEIRPGYEGMFSARQRPGNVTINMSSQPFWAVVREVCARGNISLYNSGGDESRAIQIAPGNYGYSAMRPAASIRGPFMVALGNLQRINYVNMSSPNTVDRKIQISINTFVEPNVSISQVSYNPVIEEAVDDNGNSMVPPQQDNEHRNMQSSRGISFYGNMSLPYPTTNPGKRIVKLKGNLPATLHLASEPIEIADPLKAAETTKTVSKRKVTFKSLKKEGQGYGLELVFYRDDQDQRQFHEIYNESINLKLTDAQGRSYRFYNSGGSGGQDTITRKITFQRRTGGNTPAPDEPVKLIIEVPTGRIDIAIPFELVDLPLP